MKREFKFRFWCKDLGKYIYRQPLRNDFNHPNIRPEQYTGIKDMDGNKVCEGDAIEFYRRKEKLPTGKNAVKVIFYNGAFGYRGDVTNDFYPFCDSDDLIDGQINNIKVVQV